MHVYVFSFLLSAVACTFAFIYSCKNHACRLRNCFILSAAFLSLAMGAALFAAESLGKTRALYTAAILLFLFIVALLLIWSGAAMIKHESGIPSGVYQIILGVLIALAGAGSFAFLKKGVAGFGFGTILLRLMVTAFLYSVFLLSSFALYVMILPLFSRPGEFGTIIVHGCALIRGNQVSHILAGRLETALKLFRASENKALIVVSGGMGDDETITEAEAMASYLRERGVPDDRIIRECRSHSTEENLLFSRKLIPLEKSRQLAIVTSDYHLFRCLLQARELGIECNGFGARVAAYYWPGAVLREFAAVFSRRRYLVLSLLGYVLLSILEAGLSYVFGI